MTMKEKIIARREAEKMRNTVEITYSDGATGTTTIDKLLREDETPVLPDGIIEVMVKKFATNYASRVLAELLQPEPVFGMTKAHIADIDDLNYSLELIGVAKINAINNAGLFELVSVNDLNKALEEVNKTKYSLMDAISDIYGDTLGIGFVKVGYNYVPLTQIPISPIDCTLSSGGFEIEIDINPHYMCDLDKDFFADKVCSFKKAIENAVAYELLDQDQE